ncbi:GIY-YIG nuclease family protein [Pseudonocardia zijingensis]|uniref:GIY-YIG domain-containing protein n=1 Tax=Pseudonocardia zijingensis TaxID=153376 RepID=A0ABN1N8T0_9PSEU
MTALPALPTFLYRLRDSTGRLLYVGITDNVRARMTAHARTQPWWSDVADVAVETHPSRQAALRAEAEAIRDEAPLWNIARGQRVPIEYDLDDPRDFAAAHGMRLMTDEAGLTRLYDEHGKLVMLTDGRNQERLTRTVRRWVVQASA